MDAASRALSSTRRTRLTCAVTAETGRVARADSDGTRAGYRPWGPSPNPVRFGYKSGALGHQVVADLLHALHALRDLLRAAAGLVVLRQPVERHDAVTRIDVDLEHAEVRVLQVIGLDRRGDRPIAHGAVRVGAGIGGGSLFLHRRHRTVRLLRDLVACRGKLLLRALERAVELLADRAIGPVVAGHENEPDR